MPLYEHVFLARQDLAQTQVDALAEAATKIIEDNGGKVAKVETWGLRNIAYRIRKNRNSLVTIIFRGDQRRYQSDHASPDGSCQ